MTIRIMIKTLDGRKQILSRVKDLKGVESYKRFFISPDLTRKQQTIDNQLRTELKRLRECGEVSAKIKYGKIIKNGRGERRSMASTSTEGREEVWHQLVQLV